MNEEHEERKKIRERKSKEEKGKQTLETKGFCVFVDIWVFLGKQQQEKQKKEETGRK